VKINVLKIDLRAATAPSRRYQPSLLIRKSGFSWPFIAGVRNGSMGHTDSSTMHDGRS
jgi:hypothetical protein